MPNLVQLTTSQFNTFTRQRLRRILVWVIISLVALLAIGVIISLFWPKEWNPLLVSLILNITSGLIGAAVAILTAIFVVQKFLDDRKKEEETKYAQYNAIWTLVQITSIKVEMYTIANICLFVAFGKDRYQKLADCDVNDIPDSIGDFIYAFTRRLVNETEKTSETSYDKEKHSKEDKQTWSRWKQAFASEVPIKTSCSTRDVDILLEMLHGHKADI